MKISDGCCVCLKGISLISLSNVHFNSETIHSILSGVVPEVHWKKTFSICSNCLKTLDVVIEFRNLCLKSSSYRIEQEKEHPADIVILEAYSIQNEENNEEVGALYSQDFPEDAVHKKYSDESSDIICKICSDKIKSYELIYTHNKEIGKNQNICSNCSLKKNDPINQKRNNDEQSPLFGSSNKEINLKTVEHEEKLHNVVEGLQCKSDISNNTYSTEILNEKLKKIQNEFVCFHCNKSYKNKVILAKHIKLSHQNEKHRCSYCTVMCSNETLLKKHYKNFMIFLKPIQLRKTNYTSVVNVKSHIRLKKL
ncbi:hypothetical protein WA026_016708 [Henosepilachna vigintioctopunctata]|uniref:C2H2-type domain-containing protein n=1 Tax=Henosepilachna vigintioctopunctata TaxID=420089 RepID=A0AAW1V0Y8_9CUCU